MSIMSPDSKGLGKPMHSRLSVVMQMSPMIMPQSRHSRMQSPADLSLPSVDTPGASFGQEAHHVCSISNNYCSWFSWFCFKWIEPLDFDQNNMGCQWQPGVHTSIQQYYPPYCCYEPTCLSLGSLFDLWPWPTWPLTLIFLFVFISYFYSASM